MSEKSNLKLNLSTFIIILFVILAIFITLIFIIINLQTTLKKTTTELANNQTNLSKNLNKSDYSDTINNYRNKIEKYQNEIDNYKNEIKTLQDEIYDLKISLSDLEEEVIGEDNFILGTYCYDYDVIMEEDWTLKLCVNFTFKEDNSVIACLAGHEAGVLVGTYEIFKDSIKCVFDTYENECSATYNQKLDNEEVVILRRANDRQLQFLTQNGKTNSEDFNIKNGELRFFTYTPTRAY